MFHVKRGGLAIKRSCSGFILNISDLLLFIKEGSLVFVITFSSIPFFDGKFLIPSR